MQNNFDYTKVEYSIDGIFVALYKKVVNTTYRYDIALYRLKVIKDTHFTDNDIYKVTHKSTLLR